MIKKKIGDVLVDKGLISEKQLHEALREQAVSGKRLGEILGQQGLITELQLITAISERLSIPKVSIANMPRGSIVNVSLFSGLPAVTNNESSTCSAESRR